MTLATTTDVEAILQINITNDVDPMVVTLLELASAVVEEEVGRPLEAVAYAGRRYTAGASRSTLFLDHWPIDPTTVAVDEDGTTLTVDVDYWVDGELGVITRLDGNGNLGLWSTTPVGIEVDYTALTPTIARAETARLAAEAFAAGAAYANRPAALNGVRQLTIGRWSATADTGPTTRPGIRIDEDARRRLATIKARTP